VRSMSREVAWLIACAIARCIPAIGAADPHRLRVRSPTRARAQRPRSRPTSSLAPKVGGSRPSRVARRCRDSAPPANIDHVARWRGACASDAQGEPPTEAGAHSPTVGRLYRHVARLTTSGCRCRSPSRHRCHGRDRSLACHLRSIGGIVDR
jgi:hypothetical protein